jgi:hypothetical protein
MVFSLATAGTRQIDMPVRFETLHRLWPKQKPPN